MSHVSVRNEIYEYTLNISQNLSEPYIKYTYIEYIRCILKATKTKFHVSAYGREFMSESYIKYRYIYILNIWKYIYTLNIWNGICHVNVVMCQRGIYDRQMRKFFELFTTSFYVIILLASSY